MNKLRDGTALALSGGGFRATLFHAGALVRMNECGILPRLSRISSVSGGSITAGRMAVAWSRLRFTGNVAQNLDAEVIAPLRGFCARSVDARAIALGTISPFSTIGDELTRIYAEDLLEDTSLQSLPDAPRFTFNATNLRTGRLFRMSKPYMADWRIGQVRNPPISVAQAVAASSAFPPVLSPITINAGGMAWEKLEGADLFDDAESHGELQLTDGGAYDNLGLETVDDFSTLLVSDAGAPFALAGEGGVAWLRQPMRALDIATDQARALRKRHLFDTAEGRGQTVAFWGIDMEIGEYGLADPLPTNPALTAQLARIRTRLDPFNPQEQGHLINWGYALADAAIRRHLPAEPPPAPEWPAPKWPVPDQALDR
jgi:NTE family protein